MRDFSVRHSSWSICLLLLKFIILKLASQGELKKDSQMARLMHALQSVVDCSQVWWLACGGTERRIMRFAQYRTEGRCHQMLVQVPQNHQNNYLPEALWKKLLENSMDFRESDRLRPGMQKTFAWAHCSCGGAQKECLWNSSAVELHLDLWNERYWLTVSIPSTFNSKTTPGTLEF